MSIRALIVDVDHTFYDHGIQSVPPKHQEAVRRMRQKGYKVALCTGRPLSLLHNLMPVSPGDFDGIVAGNGCAAYDENLHPLYETFLPPKAQQKLFELARAWKVPLLCASGQSLFLTQTSKQTQKILEDLHIHDIPILPACQDPCSLVEFFREDPSLPLAEAEAMEGVQVVYFPAFTDVNPIGMDKVRGIRALMKHWNLEKEDYVAFGDSINDVPMLQDAAIGVAMANASQEAREAADEITTSCAQGGIYDWLQVREFL